jgi:hypothetical protein
MQDGERRLDGGKTLDLPMGQRLVDVIAGTLGVEEGRRSRAVARAGRETKDFADRAGRRQGVRQFAGFGLRRGAHAAAASGIDGAALSVKQAQIMNAKGTTMKLAPAILAALLLGSPAFAAAQDPPPPEKRAAWIVPLDGPALVGKPVTFSLKGHPGDARWELGDGATADGSSIKHTYQKPGVYRVVMGSRAGDALNELSSAIVRVHTPETLHLPQVILDTDARNEVDDQHYLGYGLFSNVDVLGINSIHHGLRPDHGGEAQEPINYGEIHYIIQISRASGLLKHRPENLLPQVFHGARLPLQVPASGNWTDTQPVKSEASEAILAAARGASPDNPVWVLPVGPCTNVASAILLAREEGLDLKSRIRIVWLGGGPEQVHVKSFNGRNDPWSVYVTGQSGLDFWIILENPTGASITMDKRVESDLYPKNPLGKYLEAITPAGKKALYNLTTVSMVIGNHLGKPWLTSVEPSGVLGPDQKYRWEKMDSPSNVRIIRDIDEEAMKADFFATLNGKPAALPPTR